MFGAYTVSEKRHSTTVFLMEPCINQAVNLEQLSCSYTVYWFERKLVERKASRFGIN